MASPSRSLLLPLLSLTPLLAACIVQAATSGQLAVFDENYAITWGGDHIQHLDSQREIVLSMDKTLGSGFGSKHKYTSGFFHLNIKLPGKNSAGVVTAFYLSSNTSHHDELDFEFLGNLEGKPIILQTNVFVNGQGNREQRINLWFDPTADFHGYKILWNPNQIVFYVDDVPFRVFGNKTNKGVSYPAQPMQILASLWNGESWATDGGKTKIDWSYAPFMASFRGFNVDGCATESSSNLLCSSPSLWWNSAKYTELSSAEKLAYLNVKKNYITYDYCADTKRYPTLPPECPQ